MRKSCSSRGAAWCGVGEKIAVEFAVQLGCSSSSIPSLTHPSIVAMVASLTLSIVELLRKLNSKVGHAMLDSVTSKYRLRPFGAFELSNVWHLTPLRSRKEGPFGCSSLHRPVKARVACSVTLRKLSRSEMKNVGCTANTEEALS